MGSTTRPRGWSALVLFLSFQVSTSHGADAIRQGESIRDGETLVSSGNRFKLGFFSPPSSKNRYVGIWFKQVTVQTVVWVANRENYLTDNSGILTISHDGNLLILDGGRKSTLWASVSAPSTNSSSATIQDDGNFILKTDEGEVVWQSFDYPTDTILAGMKVGLDLKMGRNWLLVSWRSPEDPAPGSYSLEADPEGPLRFLIKQNGSIYWSSGAWNGVILGSVPELKRSRVQNFSFVANEDERSMTYSLDDAGTSSLVVLNSTGQLHQLIWIENQQYWNLLWAQPRDECEEYNTCGGNAFCSFNDSIRCNCLQGFFWADGQLNRSSARCIRQTNLMCGNEDEFYAVTNIKFPDQSLYKADPIVGVKNCESQCRNNCSCTAYASAYSNGTGGCLFWGGDLTGIRDSPIYINGNGFATGKLYIRLGGSDKGSMNSTRKISLIIGVIASVVVLSLFLCHLRQRKLKSKGRTETAEEALGLPSSTANDESYLSESNGPDLPFFSFATIVAATDNFAPWNKLGQGGFGPVYKGQLPEGQEIAVKRLSRSSGQGLEEFKNEVLLISKLQHQNLVRLLGWSVGGEEKILIYEYLPNKSLDNFLFGERSFGYDNKKLILDWGKRVQIIEGIAQGLLYLHQYSRLRIIHRDLKASNVLLDRDMNPKISDFGLARVIGGNQSGANTNRVVGTYGYMSPEYAMGGVFSVKSDVFSFGVLLLEIVGGKKNTSFHQFDGSLNLLGYAWELWQEGRSLELIDPTLVDSSPTSEILRYVRVALLCVQSSAIDRPTMSEVVHMLTGITATMAVPKEPAFFIRRTTEVDNSSSKPTVCSVNEVTVSEMEGR